MHRAYAKADHETDHTLAIVPVNTEIVAQELPYLSCEVLGFVLGLTPYIKRIEWSDKRTQELSDVKTAMDDRHAE